MDWISTERRKFFQSLLLQESNESNKENRSNPLNSIERESRSHDKKQQLSIENKTHSTLIQSSTPTLNAFLREKKAVTDSIFRKYSPQATDTKTLPAGLQQEGHSFETGEYEQEASVPFPRSISNLEKRNNEKESLLNQQCITDRPLSVLSQTSDNSRSTSLPREGSFRSHKSLIGHEEYKKYVLELLHRNRKNKRFQQLQGYYLSLIHI